MFLLPLNFFIKFTGVKIFNVTGSLVEGIGPYYTHAIGETISIYHSTFGNIEFVVAAKNQDGYGFATLISKNIITKQNNVSVARNYSTSSVRTWLNGEFYNGFDNSFKPLIKQVKKTSRIESSGSIVTEDYCWLLSLTEVGLTFGTVVEDGTLYSNIFTSDASRIKTYNGQASSWLLRSSAPKSGGYDIDVNVYGNIGSNTSIGINYAPGIVVGMVV